MHAPCAWPPDRERTMASSTPTPQQRLASSRLAIVRHMHHNEEPADHDDPGQAGSSEREAGAQADGTWGILKQALGTWWHHHPAHLALDVAKPVLGSYAKNHPVKLIGIAAAVGALAVVVRPWRLVSMGGLLIAAIRSSDLSSTVLSMLSASTQPEQVPDQPDN